MSYFQQSILSKHIALQNQTELAEKWAQFQASFGNPDKQANIRASKEEQYQEGFLNDLFVKIFGYTLNPEPNFNLVTEQKNQTDSKKADGAIIHNHQVIAVIELKGTDTRDLNKIVEQAFGYKNNNAHCRYVIVSNFQKIRFYIQNATEYLEFDLFALNEVQFQIMYLIFKKENLCSGLPEQIKAQSLSAEEAITKQLYADYSAFKRDLFADLIQHNLQHDKLSLFQKSQKLLDRFLFIFFAEDCKLLPPNAILNIIGDWEKLAALDVEIPLYERIKQYFGWLDSGNEAKQIFAYNGGLFKPDAELDALVISDSVLEQHCRKIAQYDFSSQIDVNILGHIFEHSLNEIDEIHAELNGEKIDKKQSKRKKDGVFYTPKYITQYIIQNTVGKLCADKKAELGLSEDYLNSFKLPEKGMRKETAAKLIAAAQEPLQKIEAYRQWLLGITICDPACGSGAFLNEALNFLIAEHTLIDEMQSRLAGSSMVYQNIEHAILERNLYGVDINEESVEIAKLSLWLRTAQRHRKLNNLNNNIMCGNSLIEDTAVAGDKAFSFQTAFPQVFEQGGFDVVIGNPPYGAKLSNDAIQYLCAKYGDAGLSKTLSDTYIAFYIVGLKNLLKESGLLGYITPNTWRLVQSGEKFRQFLLSSDFAVQKLVQHTEHVFADAVVDVDTAIIEKSENDEQHQIEIQIGDLNGEVINNVVAQSLLGKQESINLLLTPAEYSIKAKLDKFEKVKDLLQVKNGVKPYEKGKGKPAQTAETLKDKPFTSETRLDDSFSPLIGGSNFHRYVILWDNDNWIQYGEWLAAPREESIFQVAEKLIFRQTSDRIIGCFIGANYIMRNNTHIVLAKDENINLRYALAVLNSKLTNLYYSMINPEQGEVLAEVKAFHLESLPLPKISLNEQQPFIELAETMLQLNRDVQTALGKFERLLCRRFNIEKPSKALQQWFELDFKAFAAALKKHKVNLSLKDEIEWEELFTESQADIRALQAKMAATDQTIDEKVFALYGLSDEEIALVCA